MKSFMNKLPRKQMIAAAARVARNQTRKKMS
jgi:hypothetical protein